EAVGAMNLRVPDFVSRTPLDEHSFSVRVQIGSRGAPRVQPVASHVHLEQVVRLTRTLDRAQPQVATRSLQRPSGEVLAHVESPRSTVEPRTRAARLHVLRDTGGSPRHEPRNVVRLLEVVSA